MGLAPSAVAGERGHDVDAVRGGPGRVNGWAAFLFAPIVVIESDSLPVGRNPGRRVRVLGRIDAPPGVARSAWPTTGTGYRRPCDDRGLRRQRRFRRWSVPRPPIA